MEGTGNVQSDCFFACFTWTPKQLTHTRFFYTFMYKVCRLKKPRAISGCMCFCSNPPFHFERQLASGINYN